MLFRKLLAAFLFLIFSYFSYITFFVPTVNIVDVAKTIKQEAAHNVKQWVRPNVPPKVGLQVGHWKNAELPKELEKLIGSTGTSGGGKVEWEVAYKIAEQTAQILKENNIEVDILPATIPKEYWADAFISIHADGSLDTSKTGFKIAGPRRGYLNDSDRLIDILYSSYEHETKLNKDPNITRNMRGYYAFSWWRYDHSIHPMTSAAIVETGFLTNYSDQQMLINTPNIPAQGIAKGVIEFLKYKRII